MAVSDRKPTGTGMLARLPPIQSNKGQLTDQQISFITDHIALIVDAMNGHISFGDGTNSSQSGNIDGQIKEMTFVNANTDYEVPHGLGRVPIGLIVLDSNSDGAVTRGSNQGSWSSNRLFVRCNVAGTTVRFVVV